MRTLLVHNPAAGSGQPTAEALLEILDEAGFSTTYCSSKSDDFDEALAQPADMVIVAGGDGTVAKVARSLSDRKTLLGVLPLGTANNVARCLGITGKAETLVPGLRGAPVRRLDIGKAAGPWGTVHFLESVGWGALAKAVDSDGPKLPKHERIKKGRELFAKILAEAKPQHVKLVIDGDEIGGEFIFVEVLNLGMTGPRVLISPSAEPGDQLLDVVYLPAERRQEMIGWLGEEPDGRRPPLEIHKARKVHLAWEAGPLRVDDEVFDAPELASNIIVELEPNPLRVCVPGEA